MPAVAAAIRAAPALRKRLAAARTRNAGPPRAQATMPGANADELAYAGACHCGATKVSVRATKAVGRSICHCATCRRLSGAPFLAQALFPADTVVVEHADGAEPWALDTSQAVRRFRCASCGSPTHATLGTYALTAVPLSMLVPDGARCPPELVPKVHLYYDERVLDIPDDGLPRYSKSARGPLWNEEG